MSFRTQLTIWVVLLFFAILFLFVFRNILLPFVLGLALAYLLNPAVTFMERIGIRRPFGAMLVLLAAIALVTGLLLMLVPMVVEQALELIARLPNYITTLQNMVQDWAPQLADWLGAERTSQLEASLSDLITRGVELAGGLTAGLAQGGLNVINTVAVLFITPVIVFYLLVDWEGMVRKVDDLLPRPHIDEIKAVLEQIDKAMSGVIRGQGSVILVLSVYYATALTLVGLPFGLVIGLFGGLMSFIPYVGFLLGFVSSMTVAFVTYWPGQWVFILIVFAVYAIGQFLEGNILYPKLVGQSININPVWLMFALFAFALLFGFVGLLLAVPLTAISGVLIRYGIAKYQSSSLYLGDDGVLAGVPVAAAPAPPTGKPARRLPRPRRAGSRATEKQ
jgi:predicted PurR-regulated permease PerM